MSILAVMAAHLYLTGIAHAPQNGGAAKAWGYAAQNGFYGVTMFFVVSGFVISRTLVGRARDFRRLDLRAFYIRRAGRILPLFVAVLVIGFIGLHLSPSGSPPGRFCFREPKARFDASFWASLATFSFNWLRIARENETFGFGLHWDVLWSLAIEEQFYLVYPLLLRTLGTRRRSALFLAAIVVLGPLTRAAAAFFWPRRLLLGLINSFGCFDLIAMGALLSFALDAQHATVVTARRRRSEFAMACAGAALVGVIYFGSPVTKSIDCIWRPTAIGLGLCAFLGVGIRQGWWNSRLAVLLTYPGQLSYGTYVLHATVLFFLWPVLARCNSWLGFVLYATSTLTIAAGVYQYFEVPVNKRIRRRWAAA